MSNNNYSAAIFGCSGTVLTEREKRFFSKVRPVGFILFSRNIDTPEQLRALVKSLRETVENDQAPVLIDQEGGRVQRLTSPHWKKLSPWRRFGKLYEENASDGTMGAYLNARYIGMDLADLGINVDCLPLLDVPVLGSHDIIGDRAFSHRVDVVSDLGVCVCEGLMDSGVLPIIKHIPGHGRAMADSHLELPKVETDLNELKKTDFLPFKQLSFAPWAMTAHVMYTAVDDKKPASLSEKVIGQIIRDYIGFDGFLICDDLSMKALNGDFSDLTIDALTAGCDAVLHCNGDFDEMEAVAKSLPVLTDKAQERLERSFKMLSVAVEKASFKDKEEISKKVDVLLGQG